MANYFSNHSSSRFLSNNTVNANNSNTSSLHHTAVPSASNVSSSAPPVPASRSRLPSSKHFSTSVSTTSIAERNRSKDGSPNSSTPSSNGVLGVHPLRNTWVIWFRQQRVPGNKITNYEEGIKKISAFSSVESFWSLWTHLAPPSALQPTTDYLVFHSGIRRPVWEDPLNISGGKWVIRLKKGVADRIWEDLVLAIIGDQFDECRSEKGRNGAEKGTGGTGSVPEDGNNGNAAEWPEICGCTISVRQSEDIVSLWNRIDIDPKLRDKIKDTLRKVLNLSPSTIMEYKSNGVSIADSMQEKPSYRNSALDRTPLPS